MNKILVVGRLASDPAARTTSTGKSQSNFRVAVQRNFTNADGKREADFFLVVAWGKTADFVNTHLTKGRTVAVEGRLQNRSWEAQDGSKRYVTEIIADNVETVGSLKEDVPVDAGGSVAPVDDGNADFIEVTEQIDLPF